MAVLPVEITRGLTTGHLSHHADLHTAAGIPSAAVFEGSQGHIESHLELKNWYDVKTGTSLPSVTGPESHEVVHEILHAYVNSIPADRDLLEYGTYKPSGATTGVLPGTTLTPHNGNINANTPGQIIENLDISGRISVGAADVIIRNCIVRGGNSNFNAIIDCTSSNAIRVIIEDVTIIPAFPQELFTGVLGSGFTLRRADISGCVDFVGVFDTQANRITINGLSNTYYTNVVVEGCWMHDFDYFSPCSYQKTDNQTHNDGIQIQGGVGVVFKGNFVDAIYGPNGSHQPLWYGTTPSGWPNPSLACILFNNNVGMTGQHVITDNWFAHGYLPINCGGASGSPLGIMHRNEFDGNAGLQGNPKYTIVKLNNQTLDAGVGTPNQNIFSDGTPITVRSTN